MNGKRKRKRTKSDMKSRIIERQNARIDDLKNRISELEIDCKEKDDLIHSVDSLRKELSDVVDEIKNKSDEYDKLRDELVEMRDAMNNIVFKGRWRVVKWLLK